MVMVGLKPNTGNAQETGDTLASVVIYSIIYNRKTRHVTESYEKLQLDIPA